MKLRSVIGPMDSPAVREALRRGDDGLRKWVQLLETGTAEQVDEEIIRRGLAIRFDCIRAKATRALTTMGRFYAA